MFGYLTADRQLLTPEEDARYRAAYCGLCRNLRTRYGQSAGFTLNYDLCFLILLLQSLYEDGEESGSGVCLAHPVKEREWWSCKYTDYAADLTLALSYLKLLDDWQDEGKLGAKLAADTLKSKYSVICSAWPRQTEAMERSLQILGKLEEEKREEPDAAAESFAGLMAEAFVYREDRWAPTLRNFGAALGRFLYIADAMMDLDRDAAVGSFNPFRRYYGLQDNEGRFRDILRMLLGDALSAFDRLPLVTDVGLLKNILCFGLWTEFDRKYGTDRKE